MAKLVKKMPDVAYRALSNSASSQGNPDTKEYVKRYDFLSLQSYSQGVYHHIYVYMYMCICVYVCVRVCTCVYVYTFVYMYIHVYIILPLKFKNIYINIKISNFFKKFFFKKSIK